jgi:tRNA dimethylallyltransferase
MVEAGALDEVAGLLAAGLDPELPAMKALGVAALGAHLRGEIDRDAAAEQVRRETRNFAKRQMTWFRHQYRPDVTVSGVDPTAAIEAVTRFLLTACGSGTSFPVR